MFNKVSPSSMHRLAVMERARTGRITHLERLPMAAAPTVFLVKDPTAPLEELLALWDQADPNARRGRVSERRRADRLGQDEDGHYCWNGRVCCLETLRDLDPILYRLPLPHRVECTCGAIYEIRMAPREERKHGV